MPLSLEKIVLRACNKGAFTAAESGWLVSQLNAADRYCIHQGEELEVNEIGDAQLKSELETTSWRYLVEDCQPLRSGQISESTEIVVRREKSSDIKGASTEASSTGQVYLPKPYLLSTFIKSKTLSNDSPITFEAHIVLVLSNKYELGDSNSVIYVSSVFAAKHRLFNSSYVFVCYDNGDAEQTKRDVKRSKRQLESSEDDQNTILSDTVHSMYDKWRYAEVKVITKDSDFGVTIFPNTDTWAAVSSVVFYNLSKNSRLPASGLVPLQLKVCLIL